ncbi:hypothetical protein HDZ31DRAFT_49621, partial [Schizophyllum fasciatum]
VRQRAVQLVDRWRASAPAKRSNSSARTTQISQQEGLRRYGSSMSRRMSASRDLLLGDSSKKQASVDQTSASARSEAPKQVMGPPANPVSRGRKPARDAGKSKSSASASISARSGRSVSNSTSADEPPEPHIKPERSFESDRPGEAASLHEVPLRALTIELFYDALVAGTDDLPSESILPTAIGIEDGIYLETGASEDEYVSCAHAAFLALSTASSVSTMRNDLLAGSIGADGFVDYILKEEGQTT